MEIQRPPVIVAGKQAGYAKGAKVMGARGFVALAGSVPIDVGTGKIPDDMGERARIVMQNIKDRIEEYGSSLKNILIWRRYIVGDFPNGVINDPKYQEMDKALQDFWRENCPEFLRENNPPASTLLGVPSLAQSGFSLEIEVVAAIE